VSKSEFLQNLSIFKGLIVNWAIVSGGGIASVGANLPLTSSGGGNPVVGWDTTQADILTRQLFGADGSVLLNWTDRLRVGLSYHPDTGQPGDTLGILQIDANVDPLASTTDRFYSAVHGNLAADPFNTGFGLQQIVGGEFFAQHTGSSSTVNSIMALNASTNHGDPLITGGRAEQLIQGNFFTQVSQGYSIGNFFGLNIGANFDTGSIFSGTNPNATMITSNPNYRATGLNNIHGIDLYAQIYSAVAQGINGYNIAYNLYGSAGYMVDVQAGSNFRNGSSVADLKGMNVSPYFESGAAITDYTGVNINPQGSPVFANSGTGINIDMSNVVVSNTANRPRTLNLNGGAYSIQHAFKTQPNLFLDNISGIIGMMTIDSGSPISNTEVLVNNLSTLLLAHDDYANGPIGLGIVKIISGGQISVDNGKTVARTSDFASGSSVPFLGGGDGGTLTDHIAFRSRGYLDFGGNLNVTNFYGFMQEDVATTPGGSVTITNPWGLYIADTRAENWLKKSLVVGGTTGKVTDTTGYAIEIGDKKAFKWTPMTISERDALFPSPTEGTMVAISDGALKELQYHDGTNWLGM
jgi:hypothetical protein